jgi:hypothetical protein
VCEGCWGDPRAPQHGLEEGVEQQLQRLEALDGQQRAQHTERAQHGSRPDSASVLSELSRLQLHQNLSSYSSVYI